MPELPQRFYDKVAPNSGGCWRWTAYKNKDGYGQFSWNGAPLKAHRVAYEQLIGPIPDHLQCDHLCRVRDCVNPDHIELVTSQENFARGDGGEVQSGKTHCVHGHEYTPENTYLIPSGAGRACKTCRAQYTPNEAVREARNRRRRERRKSG